MSTAITMNNPGSSATTALSLDISAMKWTDTHVGSSTTASVPSFNTPLKWAYICIAVFAGIFALWSVLAPMNSAAIASGVLRAEGGGRKTIQHLEGGIIDSILVREGQSVKKGQVLARLDRTQSSAADSALQSQYDALLAQDARLTAERNRSAYILFPAELRDRTHSPKVMEIISGQKSLFISRKNSQFAQLAILEERIGQADAEIQSYQAQINALGDQRSLLNQEIGNVSALVREGLERQSRLLSLQRQDSGIVGQQGQLIANISRVRQTVAETRAQMIYLRDSLLTEVTTQQRDIRTQLTETAERMKSSKDVDNRREIVSPVDGKILNLKFVTKGGVVRSGEPIMDIVPRNEKIIIMAKIKANDVDNVIEGQSASVRLSPYKARMLPLLKGQVKSVGADATMDERSGQLFYETQIVMDDAELAQLKDIHLISGMPAEVFINLGERSLFQYFMQPMIDSFRRAFRED